VRRGFHTLKGSGRMVGLMDLGEVAWQVERVMNRWLEQKRPATPALLELVGAASTSFSTWISRLREGRLSGEVDAKRIVELAARLQADAPDEVTVGGVTLARGFLEIYVKEAAGHIRTLEAQYGEWRRMPGAEVPHELMRAAHTLASSSRTAGFGGVADLAGALEHWTAFSPQTVDASDVEAVRAAIAGLKAMVDALIRREAPAPGEEAARRLREIVARFEARPAPPVEAKATPAPAPAPAREKRLMRDDVDAQLLPVFLEEAQELVPHIGSDLRDWKGDPSDEKVSSSLRRLLHTFKGSARMAGAIRLGELCHLMESAIEAAFEANAFPQTLFEGLEEQMDRLSLGVERLQPAVAAPPAPAAAAVVTAPTSRARRRRCRARRRCCASTPTSWIT
jgi:chemosensory pili system protein ChpA (sensor histidine kinase/response regulator)